MLWPGRPLRRSLGDLRVALHNLNQTVGCFVTITRNTVKMNTESDWWLDVNEVEQMFHHAPNSPPLPDNIAPLKRAITLYQGGFLDGFWVRDSVDFEYWALLKRDQLHFQTICALDQVLCDCIARKAYSEGIMYAMRLLLMDPLREKTYRQLMTLLVHLDQRTAAITQYEQCRRLLANDLGISPSLETNALLNEIRTGTFLL
jgi:DNA-binding SARP family transcriptional activator